MFSLGDKVQHKITGIKGKIIGYGDRQNINGNYQITLKVELRSYVPVRPVAEDLLDKWQICGRKNSVNLSKQNWQLTLDKNSWLRHCGT